MATSDTLKAEDIASLSDAEKDAILQRMTAGLSIGAVVLLLARAEQMAGITDSRLTVDAMRLYGQGLICQGTRSHEQNA